LRKFLLILAFVASPALANVPVPEIETTDLLENGKLLINKQWIVTPSCKLKGKEIDLYFERSELRPNTRFVVKNEQSRKPTICKVTTLVKL